MTDEYDVLFGHPYRRFLFYSLCRYAEPVKLPDIANQIAVRTADPTNRDAFLRKRFWIYDELYFDHIPILSEFGAVSYDQEDDTVTFGAKEKHILEVINTEFEFEFGELTDPEETSFNN